MMYLESADDYKEGMELYYEVHVSHPDRSRVKTGYDKKIENPNDFIYRAKSFINDREEINRYLKYHGVKSIMI